MVLWSELEPQTPTELQKICSTFDAATFFDLHPAFDWRLPLQITLRIAKLLTYGNDV